MAMFSEVGLVATGKASVICPKCKKVMGFNQEDNFYKCPGCQGQFWPADDQKMTCPGCGRPMKYINLGFYKCSSCSSEFWPPEEPEEEEQEEDDPANWKCTGRVYAGAYPGLKSNAVKPGGGSSGGRKAKKKTRAPIISARYLLR